MSKITHRKYSETIYTYTLHAPKGKVFNQKLSDLIEDRIGEFEFGLGGAFIKFVSSMNYDGLTDDDYTNILGDLLIDKEEL